MSAVLADDEFKEADDNRGIVIECQKRLTIAAACESDDRDRGIKAIRFRELAKQWDTTISEARNLEGRPALTINHTDTICRRVENTLRQQRPRIKCHPVSGGARVEIAEVINGLIRHIETLSNASVAYDAAGKSSINVGWGYVRIGSDYISSKSFDQELKILPIPNTFAVYMDPAAKMPAGEDADWVIISEDMKRNEYKLKYPKASNADWSGGEAPGDCDVKWDNKETIRLAEYFRIHEVKDTLCRMSDGSDWYKSDLDKMDEQTRIAANFTIANGLGGKPMTRPTVRKQVQWFKINGHEIVDRRDLPGTLLGIFRCEGNVTYLDGRTYRKGMVEDLMDPARMFNYWRTAETERYALAPKAPWVAYEDVIEGHPEWHNANQKSYSVLVAKAAHDEQGNLLPLPVRQPPVQIEQGMMEAAQGARGDLMAIGGLPMEMAGDEGRVVSGNKYLQRRQGERDLTHFQYYDNQTNMIMWVGICLLERIPFYYDTQRMQRIIGDDGKPQMVEINKREPSEQDAAIFEVKNNLTIGRYDVVMDTGPNYVTKREEDAEKVVGALGTPLGLKMVEVGADIVARDLGMEEMADRLTVQTPDGLKKAVEGLSSQGKAIVNSMQQQIQQLQGTVQQQALEIKYKAEIESQKIKAHTAVEAAKLETAQEKSVREDKTKRFDIETVAHTRRDVAEINAATQLLNTRLESEHEERQSDKLIEKGLESES